MTRFLKILFATALISLLFCTASAAPSLISETAVLMDAETGQVLYDKNMHVQKHPASITKIATVICGLENGSLSDKITMSENAVFSVSRSSSHIALDVGEELTLEEASYAALLVSANEACNGIAEHCGGTIENFVAMMNDMARKAGTKNTTFVNANGLRNENHLTTAYDMACITRYAIQNDDFRKIFGTYKYTMAPTNKQPEDRLFVNQHYMISDPALLYDGFVGGKVGYTTDALCTLVTAAERDGRTLIAVVMKSPRDYDRYTDTKALLDYGFDNFHTLTVTKSDLPSDNEYQLEKNIEIFIEKGISVDDLTITAREESGENFIIVTSPSGEELAKVPCKVADRNAVHVFTPPPKSEKRLNPFAVLGLAVLAIVGLLIFLILLLLLAIIIRKKIYRARRRRRRRRRMQQAQQMQQRRR